MEDYYIGIEIGGTKLQIVLGNESGRISERQRFTVDRSLGGAGIRAQIQSALAALVPEHPFRGIGVGFGGPVDWKTGRICVSHHVEGWSDFHLSDWLHALTGLPVRVDNDANVAALGEARCGAGMGFDLVFYVTMGSGVGGGLTVDGRIYHGATPGESELGHVRLDRSGATVESRCSGWAVDAKIRRLKAGGSTGVLCRLVGESEGAEAKHLLRALEAGDPSARQILDETTQDLAFGLSHVVHLCHPAVIVLGGGLSLIGEPLREAVSAALPGFVMEAFHPVPAVRLAALGEDAVPVGALLLAGEAAAST